MSNPLHNICVYIEDEAQLQEARDLLERFGEVICDSSFYISRDKECNFLKIDIDWFLSIKSDYEEKITLTELQKLLEGNK